MLVLHHVFSIVLMGITIVVQATTEQERILEPDIIKNRFCAFLRGGFLKWRNYSANS